MKGDPNIIKLLNDQLTNELTAINQYFLHARMYKHWGFEKLGKKEYAESIGEMKHAVQALHKLMIGENTPEMLSCDLQLEKISQQTVKDGIAACEAARDYVSRELFQHILDDTEEHIDWLETQQDLIAKIGLENYLQSQMEDE